MVPPGAPSFCVQIPGYVQLCLVQLSGWTHPGPGPFSGSLPIMALLSTAILICLLLGDHRCHHLLLHLLEVKAPPFTCCSHFLWLLPGPHQPVPPRCKPSRRRTNWCPPAFWALYSC